MDEQGTDQQTSFDVPFTPQPEKRSFPQRYPVITFYLLAFAISWVGYAPLLIHQQAPSLFTNPLWLIALILSAAGPALAAWLATKWTLQPPGPAWSTAPSPSPLRIAFLRPVPAPWWIATLALSIGVMAEAALLSRYIHPPVPHRLSPSSFLLFSLMSLVANPLEEIGWRGFAQTRLQQRRSGLDAALVVGLLWAVWHIPLFLLASGPMSMARTPFWPWAAGVIPQAVLLAWLFNRTRSLAIVSVSHILGNLAGMLFNPSVVTVSTVRLIAACVIVGIAGTSLGNQRGQLRAN